MGRIYTKASGFTLVEIMIVVLIIGILLSIAVPNFSYAREQSRQKSCIANLIQIRGAKEEWAFEYKQPETATPGTTDLFGTGKYINTTPTCPSGGRYRLRRVNQDPTCNIRGTYPHIIRALQ